MAILNDQLSWLIDINIFMTPISHINFNTNIVDTTCIQNGIRQSSGTQNNEISYDVVLSAGTWTFELLHKPGTGVGIYTWLLNGTTIGTMDGYFNGTSNNTKNTISGIIIATAGKKRLTLRMATKNASATSYYGQIQHIQLRRTA